MELKGKKVLVTGACGFIGSHLVERLLEENCDVRALVYYNSFGNWGWLDTLEESKKREIEIVPGDIRDSFFMEKIIKGIDIVFHLAALISIPFSYESPELYVDTNVKGTLNVLKASLKNDVQRVLITSTSEVYGTAKYVPIDENHPRQGQSPYSASKIAADYLAESFYRTFNLPVVIVRPFNTYGPRQSARAVIPTIIIQALAGFKELKLGNLYPTRDFVFVKDTVEGFIRLAKTDKAIGEEVNIATGREISIGELAKKIINMINPDIRIVSEDLRKRPKKSEVERLLGDNTKLKKLTGWIPEYSLEEGLKITIEWFKKNLHFYKPDVYSI